MVISSHLLLSESRLHRFGSAYTCRSSYLVIGFIELMVKSARHLQPKRPGLKTPFPIPQQLTVNLPQGGFI